MRFHDICIQAYQSLKARKTKVAFIVSSMSLAIGSIMLFLQIDGLAKVQMQQMFDALGPNSFAVNFLSTDQRLDVRTFNRIKTDNSKNYLMLGYQFLPSRVNFQAHPLQGQLIALDEAIAQGPLKLKAGAWFNSSDSQKKVVLIGEDVAAHIETISKQNPVGQYLDLQPDLYRIKGIIKNESNALLDFSVAKVVAVPLSMSSRFVKESIDAMWAKSNEIHLEEAQNSMRALLEQKGQVVYIRSPLEYLSHIEQQAKLFKQVLAIVVAISLFSSIIITANTLWASILERKQEIGVLFSFGAPNRLVIAQLWLEILLMGLLSSAVAAFMSGGASHVIARILNWKIHFIFSSYIIGFVCALSIFAIIASLPIRKLAKYSPQSLLNSK